MTTSNTVDPASFRRRSPRRRWLFRVFLGVSVWLICEVISWIGLNIVESGWNKVAVDRDTVANPQRSVGRYQPQEDIVHPYLGFVRRPRSAAEADTALGVSEFGFPDNASPIAPRQPNEFVIGVLGGSVAEEFARDGWETLRDSLRDSAQFREKRLRIVRLGLSGYKQPQQLLLVNYLLALGGEFDVIVNLDGFNEVALPDVENVPDHVFAAFPRGWHIRVMDTDDIRVLRKVSDVAALEEEAQWLANHFARPPWRWSPTATVLWLALHRRNIDHQNQTQLEFRGLSDRAEIRSSLGPAQSFDSKESQFRHCVMLWENSSRLLHAVCQRRSIRYLHFLQPNQYVLGSKPQMGTAEKKIAVHENYPGRPAVELGFPLLRQAGQQLASEGIEFYDLTPLFQHTTEATYRDNCCHLNQTGNEILAKQIAQVLIGPPSN